MATSKNSSASTQLQRLQARLAQLEQQKAEIDNAIGTARTELAVFIREQQRNEKPTSAMLQILKVMAKGASLYSYEFNHPYVYRWVMPDADNFCGSDIAERKVRSSVVTGLVQREAITEDRERKSAWIRYFKLTDHGRAVLAAHDKEGGAK